MDQATALAKNLTYANGNTFIIRADHTTVLSASGPGRDSVRIQSNKQWSTHVAVYVAFFSTSFSPSAARGTNPAPNPPLDYLRPLDRNTYPFRPFFTPCFRI